MARTSFFLVGITLMLALLAVRSEAELGCMINNQPGGPAQFATCTTDSEDCAPIDGSVACTSGICYCPNGPVGVAPFCACLETGPATQSAPALGSSGLVGLVGLLCTVGLVGLWRRANPRRD